MAWPCISRVCCLARFWSQLDKSDLSVPLTTQNYSDITEEREVRSVSRQLPAPGNHFSITKPRARTGSPRGPADGPGTRPASGALRKERSYKPRQDYQPPGVPFPSVTQYKQDFKPWPIPRRENFPWISNGGSPANGQPRLGGKEERVRGQQVRRCEEQQEENHTSSYRHEYKPWTGAKPAKSARKTPSTHNRSPGTEANQVPCETSYQAAYSTDTHRSTGLHQGDHCAPSASSNPQPAAVLQPVSTALHAATPSKPPSLQPSILPERTGLGGATKGEELPVRTKLTPNTSAVFQSGSRIFNE